MEADLLDAATAQADGHASVLVVTLITFLYITFAGQLVAAAGIETIRTREGRAVALLVAVFVLCSLVGYASMLVPMPHAIREAAHWILAGVTACLVATNQAKVIARMLGTVP